MLRSVISALTMIGVTALVATGAVAQEKATGKEMASATQNVLLKQPLEGLDGKEANVVLIEVPPGWETPSHTHPGHLFVYVLDGAIEVALEGGETLTASAGEVIYETPDQPMVGRNTSSSEGARILVFQVGDEGQPLTAPHPKQ